MRSQNPEHITWGVFNADGKRVAACFDQEMAQRIATALDAAEQECRWTWQRLELWTTACQRVFRFDMDDMPDEESIAFCPYCGGRIVFDAAAHAAGEKTPGA